MDYKAIWNEICFYVNKNRNAEERDFQMVIESYMFDKLLGWSKFKGEIATKKIIGFGSGRNLEPDIVIEENGNEKYVVELKRPNKNLTVDNAVQLKSYMRQSKLSFGILLGKTLQVFYELPDKNEHSVKDPVKVCDILFVDNSEIGIECIEVLSKFGFSVEGFDKFCNKCLSNPEKYIEKNNKSANRESSVKINSGIIMKSDAYKIKGKKAYEILRNPENKNAYTEKYLPLYGNKLYIGTKGKKDYDRKWLGIINYLDEANKNEIDGKDFYLHIQVWGDPDKQTSWIEGDIFVKKYDDKSIE